MLNGIEEQLSDITLVEIPLAPSLEEEVPPAPPVDDVDSIPVAPNLDLDVTEPTVTPEDQEMQALREKIALLLANCEKAKDPATLQTAQQALADYLSMHQKNLIAEGQNERRMKQEIEGAKEEINSIREEFGKNIKELSNVKESLEADLKMLTAEKLMLERQDSQDPSIVDYAENIAQTLRGIPHLIDEAAAKLDILKYAMQKKIDEQEARIKALETDLMPMKKKLEHLKKLRDEAIKLGKISAAPSSTRQCISLETLIKKGDINPLLMNGLRKFILLKDDLTLSQLELLTNFNVEKIIKKYNEFGKKVHPAFNDERMILAIGCGYIFQREGYCGSHMKPLEKAGRDEAKLALLRMLLDKMYQHHYNPKELEALKRDLKADVAFLAEALQSVKPKPRNDNKELKKGDSEIVSKKTPKKRVLPAPETLARDAQQAALKKKRFPLFLQQFAELQAELDSNFKRNFFGGSSSAPCTPATTSEDLSPALSSSGPCLGVWTPVSLSAFHRSRRYKKGSKRAIEASNIRRILLASAASPLSSLESPSSSASFLSPLPSLSPTPSELSLPSRSSSPSPDEQLLEQEKAKASL